MTSALSPQSLHDALAVLDTGSPLNVGELEQFVARSERGIPTTSLAALAQRIEESETIRCALCRELDDDQSIAYGLSDGAVLTMRAFACGEDDEVELLS